jgi:hypothetical protein
MERDFQRLIMASVAAFSATVAFAAATGSALAHHDGYVQGYEKGSKRPATVCPTPSLVDRPTQTLGPERPSGRRSGFEHSDTGRLPSARVTGSTDIRHGTESSPPPRAGEMTPEFGHEASRPGAGR